MTAFSKRVNPPRPTGNTKMNEQTFLEQTVSNCPCCNNRVKPTIYTQQDGNCTLRAPSITCSYCNVTAGTFWPEEFDKILVAWEKVVKEYNGEPLDDKIYLTPTYDKSLEENTINFLIAGEEILKISDKGFFYKGEQVEQGEGEAQRVYEAFNEFLRASALNTNGDKQL